MMMTFEEAYFDTFTPPYNEGVEHWHRFFGAIADYIKLTLNPITVLDVGCAKGFLVGELRKRDTIAWGIDISQYALDNTVREARDYVSYQSATDMLPMRYALITCIEVLEHIPEADALKAIDNICTHADTVLFSSTPYHKDESTHVNIQPREYWMEQFVKRGFLRDARNEPTHLIPWVTVWHSILV